MVADRNNLSSNAWHNFAKGKVISKYKGHKSLKNSIGKLAAPSPLSRRPAPAPYLHPLFSDSPLIKIYFYPFKRGILCYCKLTTYQECQLNLMMYQVQVISSMHCINYENVRKIGDNNEYQKLYVIFQYNTFMSGVDKFDQYLSIYILNRRSIQWWKKVFFRMLELATIQW